MKAIKFISSFGWLLTLGTASAVFISCDKDDKSNPVTNIALDKTILELAIGEIATLSAEVLPADADDKFISWSSSDDSKVRVDITGRIIGIDLGKAIITAKAGDKTASCEVEVVLLSMIPVEGGITTINGVDVTISSFRIGKYEVTQKQWRKIIASNRPSEFYGDNLPVENVSYDDIQNFLSVLNQWEGKNYRLPTEAEWEYAARGGNQTKGYTYSGSNTLDDVAWSSSNNRPNYGTKPVGTKLPNELGIYDMTGNVWEWSSDFGGADYPSSSNNPTGATTGSYIMYRGGGWYSLEDKCRVSSRDLALPRSRYNFLGFRVVLPLIVL